MPPWQPEDQSFWFTTQGNFLNLRASWIHGPFNVNLFSECDVTIVHAPPPPPATVPNVVIEQRSEVVVETPEPVVIEREVTVERVVEVEVAPADSNGADLPDLLAAFLGVLVGVLIVAAIFWYFDRRE
jgi:hypothetical protein